MEIQEPFGCLDVQVDRAAVELLGIKKFDQELRDVSPPFTYDTHGLKNYGTLFLQIPSLKVDTKGYDKND